ncbi:VOC family protein [Rhodophyticola sp. CCM32]|uniref:VOC family protein n=1 Tax=Rhodophyticola sp. CCM32 TaxID=2916397 RepID=UPI00107F67CC|nr:VOC family protein [Rhodophyticola sp. CCM32]QBX99452.1 VOC family protein [Rhodophyticola sp. CCM32]
MPVHPKNTACWFEIPVRDLDRSVAFYNAVLDTDMTIDTSGPNPMAVFPYQDPATGTSGHIYPGTPSENGPTVHLVAPDSLAATRKRVEAAGGKAESPDIAIPAGAFFYARDPDGNSIGFFQYAS